MDWRKVDNTYQQNDAWEIVLSNDGFSVYIYRPNSPSQNWYMHVQGLHLSQHECLGAITLKGAQQEALQRVRLRLKMMLSYVEEAESS